jgi:hypothetical protein
MESNQKAGRRHERINQLLVCRILGWIGEEYKYRLDELCFDVIEMEWILNGKGLLLASETAPFLFGNFASKKVK